MLLKLTLPLALVIGCSISATAQEPQAKPVELEVVKGYVGVWDAEIEVWAAGQEAPPIKFNGVETNRAYGEYWIASDFDSQFMGQTIKVHSIIGYDRDKKKLVGTVIDHGPYAACMTGEYDEQTKTVHWTTQAKDLGGNPLVQKTTITQESVDERVLVLTVPNGDNEFRKFMQIKFVRRK